ncbi:hypothetical protein MLD38_008558 [Melastoma candidum]|uniref:Uncharacterized protein n=1 Tax=Melastoma candidum TaxID=119954 RepID=A0ACB9RWK7_9MYRT|nr:hypothetical protein MLD38_008558 [Melastoma candidum]
MATQLQSHVIGVPVASSEWQNSTMKAVMRLNCPRQYHDLHLSENTNRSLVTCSVKAESAINGKNRNRRKADVFAVANSVREHVRLSPKLSEALKGKLSLGARILQGGGMRKVFKHLFSVSQKEKLIRASQCYLSTTAGPIAGILFVSTEKVSFCSERTIKLSCPNGKSVRVHYKVTIPLEKIEAVNQSENVKRPSQKYMQIVTADNFDFWFMGFLNYQKSFETLQQVISQV